MRLLFQRGTLLLEDPPADFAGTELPGLVLDPRVERWRAPAYRYAAVHAELYARRIAIVDEIPSAWPRPRAWRTPDLRPYQADALTRWQRAGRCGVLCLPTGSGKTRIALAAMASTGLRSLCLAPTRVLVEQWRREIERFYGGPVGWFGDGNRDEQAITVATFESAARHMDRIGGRFDLLVVDEAHHVGGLARSEMLEMSVARARMGLTATPPLAPSARTELERLVGPVVVALGLADLAGSAVLAFDRITVAVELSPSERRAYEEERERFAPLLRLLRRQHPGARWPEVIREAGRFPEGRRAVEALRRARRLVALTSAKARALAELLERHRDSRVLVFTPDNATACAVARAQLIMPITCDVGRREREQALARFQRGEIRALVSTRALNEGIDVPDAEVAILLGGGGGERAYLQRIGRILRPAPGKSALLYEIVARGTLEMAQLQRRREGLAARVADPR